MIKTRVFLLSALFFLTNAVSAYAADIVAKTIVDGKTVVLMSDNTWQYADQIGARISGCETVHPRISFCPEPAMWTPINLGGAEITASFRHSDREYALFVVEELGSNDGVTLEYMADTVIEAMALGSEIDKRDVVVHSVEDTHFLGNPAVTLVYQANLHGLDVIYVNTISVSPTVTVQVITSVISHDYLPEHEALHMDLIGDVKLARDG